MKSQIVDFQEKPNFRSWITPLSMKNELHRSKSGVLALAQIAFFFKKLIKFCIWTNMVKINEISKNFFLCRLSVCIFTQLFKIFSKKCFRLELSLSEIMRFSKIRNHDVFRNLYYIYFKLNSELKIFDGSLNFKIA